MNYLLCAECQLYGVESFGCALHITEDIRLGNQNGVFPTTNGQSNGREGLRWVHLFGFVFVNFKNAFHFECRKIQKKINCFVHSSTNSGPYAT